MKEFLYKNIKNIAIILLIVACFISVNKCVQNNKISKNQISSYEDQVKIYKNKLGTLTAQKQVLQISNKDFKNIILEKDEELKKLTDEFSKVKTIVITNTIVKIDSIPVPFEVAVPFDFERSGIKKEKFYSFNYLVNQNGITLSGFEIPNKQTVITGFKRKWLLGRQTMVTDITNSNELIQTTDVKTIEVIVPKRFYDTRAFNIGIGFLTGALLFR